MLEQLVHMKRWALQNQDALTKEQLCRAFAAMCDDAIAEYNAAQQQNAVDRATPDESRTASETPGN